MKHYQEHPFFLNAYSAGTVKWALRFWLLTFVVFYAMPAKEEKRKGKMYKLHAVHQSDQASFHESIAVTEKAGSWLVTIATYSCGTACDSNTIPF